MEKDLRQGDHLSHFVFLLVTEGLNVLMNAVIDSNLFTGYNIGTQKSIAIFHLQFADDTLLVGAKNWANI